MGLSDHRHDVSIYETIILHLFCMWHTHLIPVCYKTQTCWIQPAWAVLAYRLYDWETFLHGFSLPSSHPLPDKHLTQLSPPWDWIVKASPDQQTHPKPQLQRSWRYILSSACFLAPVQTHNEWSRPPQPGATPSTLFTLLPFTHSSCSSPNDAGPSYWWSKAGRELFSLWLHFKLGPFLKLNFITSIICFSWACFLNWQLRIFILAYLLVPFPSLGPL